MVVVAGLGVLLTRGGGDGGGGRASDGLPRSARRAPAIELENLDEGRPAVSLASYRGTPVVVNFWGSWCVPCRQEMPDFQAEHRRLGDRVVFLGVDEKDNRDAARRFVRDRGVTYPSGYDPNEVLADDYQLVGLPRTAFVGADGRLLHTVNGQLSRARLQGLLRDLFGIGG